MVKAHKISFFWFRRDLRLTDNPGLWTALKNESHVVPLFIFDTDITDELRKNDARISFIYNTLRQINAKFNERNSSLLIMKGKPLNVWKQLISTYKINSVYLNKDYEPYAIDRDLEIEKLLTSKGISLHAFKDQVIFEPEEVLNNQNKPYTVYTPYKNKWLSLFSQTKIVPSPSPNFNHLSTRQYTFPSLESLGFSGSSIMVHPFTLDQLDEYGELRDYPAKNATSFLGPHLRFGTIGIRELIIQIGDSSPVFLSELIWREFFKQILFHFPRVVTHNFYKKYDQVPWRNDKGEFSAWCKGQTGYPLVDAGMRQLNDTGYMHNRVRMVTASFLCKHLLIDWRWGEAYFAQKLLDYDLSSNNGNWQWAAGTGCDAAPYFRVFNPETQMQKFDKSKTYVKTWVPEYGTSAYAKPIVEHHMARLRAISTYRDALRKEN